MYFIYSLWESILLNQLAAGFFFIGLEFFSLVGSNRKSIKTIFKNNFSSYHGSFVINKNANIEKWKKKRVLYVQRLRG